jgi:hypothetical protein
MLNIIIGVVTAVIVSIQIYAGYEYDDRMTGNHVIITPTVVVTLAH